MPLGFNHSLGLNQPNLNATSKVVATGGDGMTLGWYSLNYLTGLVTKIHDFKTAGTKSFPVTTKGLANIVMTGAGGGGGGTGATTTAGSCGGGGGGGQAIMLLQYELTPQTYSFTIGAGGTGTTGVGGTGGSTTAFGYTLAGGGGGGAGAVTFNGSAGGNAGGGGAGANATTSGTGGTGTAAGGNSFTGSSTTASGGAGGGQIAGSPGTSGVGGTGNVHMMGWDGRGNNIYLGPSGGGGGASAGSGAGGGGAGAVNGAGLAGTIWGQGGGGARTTNTTAYAGGSGAPGYLMITYPVSQANITATYNTFAQATTASITCPTVQAGDLLILLDWAWNSTTTIPTTVTPAGWTQFATTSLGTTLGSRLNANYKIAAGTESATSITGMTATNMAKMLIVYRPNIPLLGSTELGTAGSVVYSAYGASCSDTAITGTAISGLSYGGLNMFPAIAFCIYASTGNLTARPNTATPTREIINTGTKLAIKLFEACNNSTVLTNYGSIQATANDYGTNALISGIFPYFR